MACGDGHWHAARIATLSLILVAGCAAPNSPRETALATVELPRAVADISDRRAEFAAVFAEALQSQAGADTASSAWLHGADKAPGASAAAVSTMRDRYAARAASTSVLVVPGLFGDCIETQSVPFGDGVEREGLRNHTEAYRGYDDLGVMSIHLVALPGRESVAHNGRRLADAIRTEVRRPGVERIVLVAYSKGVADALQALVLLQAEGGVPRPVRALVSVAGLVAGSFIVERFGPVYRALAPGATVLGCAAADGEELDGLTREQRARWLATHPLPRHIRYFSVVAHASQDETAPALRPFHAALSELDPRNDGQILAVNALIPGSALLAEARTDHWGVALPLERHPSAVVRALGTERPYPREALFRAIVWWAVADAP